MGKPLARARCRALTESDVPAGVLPRFREVVAGQPDKVAVADATGSLTYAELAARAGTILTQVRTALTALDPPPARRGPAQFGALEPVAILYGHELDAVAALIAVLASGHPVLVLDPQTPRDRLVSLAAGVDARLIVAAPELRRLAARVRRDVLTPAAGPAVADQSTRSAQLPDPAETLWAAPPDPAGVAVVAYTSGSTGTPKPVANDHRLLVRDAWNSSIATGCYDDADVLAHTLPLAFHAGLTTAVHGLLVGATMHLYDTRSHGVRSLARFIRDTGCTVMVAGPAILRSLCATAPEPAQLRTLRRLTIAGEPAPAADVLRAQRLLPPSCVIRNRYGTSETGLVTEYVVDAATADRAALLPVGRGVGWTIVELVDGGGHAVRDGDVGRIRVRAPSVALGYWGLPRETAAAFGTAPDGLATFLTSDLGRRLPRGDLMIIGRADHAVKIRGYLVDPGEVDAALHGLPGVREAATVSAARPHTDEGGHLVSYVAVDPSSGLTGVGIRAALARRLPAHMVPEGIHLLAELPRNDRGKIDRAGLAGHQPSRAETDQDVIWTGVLESPVEPCVGRTSPGSSRDARGGFHDSHRRGPNDSPAQ